MKKFLRTNVFDTSTIHSSTGKNAAGNYWGSARGSSLRKDDDYWHPPMLRKAVGKDIKRFFVTIAFATTVHIYTTAQEIDSLQYYLKTAIQQNPTVKMAKYQYEAAKQRIPQMGAFDDPQIEVGAFTTPMATVDGKQIAEVKAMQMFPWFGSKKAAQNEAKHMASMAREIWRDAQNELCRQVATQWVQLWLIQQKIKNTQQQKQLLLHLEQLAVHKLATASGQAATKQNAQKRDNMNNETVGTTQQSGMNMSGATSNMPTTAAAPANNMQGNMTANNMTPMGNTQGGLAEILQLQLQIAETENNNESLLSQFNAEKIKFNTLLHRYPQATVALPDSLQLPALVATEQATHMPDNNPTLEMIKEEALALHAKEIMNKKMGLPMIGVGLQYMVIGKNPTTTTTATMDMTPTPTVNNMNGKDMIMPMVAITVPIYRNKHKAANKEIQLLKLANQQQYIATENQLNTDIALAKHLIDDEVRKIKLYRKQVQIVKSTYELAVQAFANGQTNLDALITVQQQLLDYTLKHDQAVATFYTNNATLNKLIMSYELEYDEN